MKKNFIAVLATFTLLFCNSPNQNSTSSDNSIDCSTPSLLNSTERPDTIFSDYLQKSLTQNQIQPIRINSYGYYQNSILSDSIITDSISSIAPIRIKFSRTLSNDTLNWFYESGSGTVPQIILPLPLQPLNVFLCILEVYSSTNSGVFRKASYIQIPVSSPPHNMRLSWDGCDSTGNKLENGNYSTKISIFYRDTSYVNCSELHLTSNL